MSNSNSLIKIIKEHYTAPIEQERDTNSPKLYEFKKFSKLVSTITLGLAVAYPIGSLALNLLKAPTTVNISLSVLTVGIEGLFVLKTMKESNNADLWDGQTDLHKMKPEEKIPYLEKMWMLYDLRQEEIAKQNLNKSPYRLKIENFLQSLRLIKSNQLEPLVKEVSQKKNVL